jgi:hypothetical protein
MGCLKVRISETGSSFTIAIFARKPQLSTFEELAKAAPTGTGRAFFTAKGAV